MPGYAETSLVRIGSAPYGTTIDKARSAYLYPTADALATVIAAGYFNGARARLKKGDVVFAIVDQDGTPTLRPLTLSAVPASGNVTTTIGDSGISGLTPLTAATGTPSNTVSDVGASFNQATLNNNFKALSDKVNAIIGAGA